MERTPLLSASAEPRRYSNTEPLPHNNERDLEESQALLDQKPHSFTDSQTWRAEAWLLLSYSAPLIVTYLLQYFYNVVTIFVAGHISSDALAAASIGVTTMIVTGYAFLEGMATALDTLCAQAYGSGNLHGVGLHVQRMLLFMSAILVPVSAIWLVSPWLFPLFLKQDYLAVLAGHFLQLSVIGLPGYAAFEAQKRFSQSQGDFTSSLVVLVVCVPVNVLLNWLFVFRFGWGLAGTALATALTQNLRPLLMLAYILVFKRWTLQCWGGFSADAFKKWGPMMQLSAAGSILNLSEWASFELMTFSSSYISTAHIAAQTILTTESVLIWHIPFSVGVAVTTRVGHLVGAGALPTARRVLTFYAAVFAVLGLLDGALAWLLRHSAPRFFSDDPRVIAIAVATAPVVASFQLVDAVVAGSCSALRGFGRQAVAAWAATLVNYLAAVPVGIWLELGPSGMGLSGCWISLQVGMVLIAAVEIVTMKVMSWQKCVDDARSRSGH